MSEDDDDDDLNLDEDEINGKPCIDNHVNNDIYDVIDHVDDKGFDVHEDVVDDDSKIDMGGIDQVDCDSEQIVKHITLAETSSAIENYQLASGCSYYQWKADKNFGTKFNAGNLSKNHSIMFEDSRQVS